MNPIDPTGYECLILAQAVIKWGAPEFVETHYGNDNVSYAVKAGHSVLHLCSDVPGEVFDARKQGFANVAELLLRFRTQLLQGELTE